MAGKAKNGDAELKLNMTPLIDVTFLILIFLMVLPFKTLERKVEAYLPKELGLDHTIIPDQEKPKITVALRPLDASRATRVKLLDSPLGAGDPAFAALDDRIAAIHRSSPEIPGEIDADGEVPHADVVRTVDSFLRAGITEITFIGAKMPGR